MTSTAAWRRAVSVLYMARFGEAIYERRDVLKLSGPDVAAMSSDLEREDPATYAAFSQQTVSRWESDTTGAKIAASSPARIRALAKILQWTPAEFEARVGVPASGSAGVYEDDGKLRLVGGLVMVPVLGVANGGKPGSYGLPVEPEMIRGENTRAFQVEGDSMATATPDGGIRDGSWVLVDMSLTTPLNGRIFLLEILGDGMTVKRLRRVGPDWLFLSDNPDAGDTWREDQVRILGEVYGRVEYTEVR